MKTRTQRSARTAAVSALAFAAFAARAGLAAAEPTRVAVEVVGVDAASVRDELTAGLDHAFVVEKSAANARLAKRETLDGVFERKTRVRAIERVREAALRAGLRGAIVARVERDDDAVHSASLFGRRAHVVVIDSTGPVFEADVVFGTTPDRAADEAALVAVIGPATEPWIPAETHALGPRTTVTAASVGAPDTLQRPPRDDRGEGDEMTRGLFVGSAALGVGARHFHFRDAITPNLRPYDLDAAPIVGLGAELYPLARTDSGVAADIGLVGDYQQALLVRSRAPEGSTADTSWRVFDVGPRVRFRVGGVSLGVALTYGQTSFDVGAAATPIRYTTVRGGADGRIDVARFGFLASVGYADVVSLGDLDDVFPRARAGAVDVHLGAAYRLARGFELRATGSYARFFASMGSEPGDAHVAGGALDQYETFTVGAAFAR